MAEVTRRSIAVGSITLLAASEVEAKTSPKAEEPPQPSFVFPEQITAMCEFGVGGQLAIACGEKLYLIKVR